jgi:hypothetical protein
MDTHQQSVLLELRTDALDLHFGRWCTHVPMRGETNCLDALDW